MSSSFNDALRASEKFRDPEVAAHLIKLMNLDEYATLVDRDFSFPPEAYHDQLQSAVKKDATGVEFVKENINK